GRGQGARARRAARRARGADRGAARDLTRSRARSARNASSCAIRSYAMRSLATCSLAIVAVASTAAADPPCLDYTHARIVGKDGKLVVCTGDELKCTAFADAKATPAAATWPGNPESPNGTYGRVDNKLAVCMGKTCNKVGDKLTKAALRVKAEISSDLAV